MDVENYYTRIYCYRYLDNPLNISPHLPLVKSILLFLKYKKPLSHKLIIDTIKRSKNAATISVTAFFFTSPLQFCLYPKIVPEYAFLHMRVFRYKEKNIHHHNSQ